MVVDKAPIAGLKDKAVIWTKPDVRVEIEYRGVTSDRSLGHAAFKRRSRRLAQHK
ncbi:hypothetical protein CHELA20_40272 [Hyphomicrobiales bacterium]|nr:hypothetical protein CHELA20_40272 [Hyphomicrobiales bacterium]CAH1687977.1 hypothetical protein CHELA41_40128 [Hyphomicrobiales bacterium]